MFGLRLWLGLESVLEKYRVRLELWLGLELGFRSEMLMRWVVGSILNGSPIELVPASAPRLV